MKLVFLDRNTLAASTQLRPLSFKHNWVNYEHTSPDQITARAADAQVVISNKVALDAHTLATLPALTYIAVPATGTNHIDLDYCQQQGIAVSNVPDYAGTTVPEHTMALLFALQRQLFAYHRSIQAGRWQQSQQFCYFDYPIRDLKGSTLGIVGAGHLGQKVAAMAQALGLNVQFAARKGQTLPPENYVSFEHCLKSSDIISLHCPLTADTKHLLGAAEFAQMQQKPLIINTARGALIDPKALKEALEQGSIRGAGIDVCDPEPPPADHPYMQLLSHPQFIMTPHVAWASVQAMQYLADVLIENIQSFEQGQPQNLVY